MVCFAAAFILCFVLRIYLTLENKRRDQVAMTAEPQFRQDANELNLADRTDMEMAAFRYVY